MLAWDDSAKARDGGRRRARRCADPARHRLARASRRWCCRPASRTAFPKPHPAVAAARAAGVEIIGDIELLGRAQPGARYIGITGTNGKSTTTALIGHILGDGRAARSRSAAISAPPALSLAPLGADGTYVLETSSFQLELIATLAFDIAVLLNITPDHLDRHGDMDGYIAAKQRIFARQGDGATAIIGIDDAICRDLADELRARRHGAGRADLGHGAGRRAASMSRTAG